MPSANCPGCGRPAPEEARFCPSCGARLAEGSTREVVIGEPEAGPGPVRILRTERHLLGMPISTALLAAALALAAAGVAALVVSGPLPGALLFGAAVVLASGSFAGFALRDEEGLAATAAGSIGTNVRLAATAGRERWRTRRRLAGLRAELARLDAALDELRHRLDASVYRGDERASERLRGEVRAVEARRTTREAELRVAVRETEHRVEEARAAVRPTEVLPPSAPTAIEVPEQPLIPEPYPPPGEADPPEPARVPEPYPQPGEADPPEPPLVPEPAPSDLSPRIS